mgnify:CR=1 FL=1
MESYSKILHEGYEKFLLPLGGKKVPTPYRINIPYQGDRRKYGKSDPKTLISDIKQIAKEQNFNLERASIGEIRKFMEDNQLGLDCSGFVYHILDFLLNQIGKGGMQQIGFPKPSSTNANLLTSEKFTIPVRKFEDLQAGDIIKLDSQDTIPHTLIILNVQDRVASYAHSSKLTEVKGVHQDKIINGTLPDELSVYSYNVKAGDGIRRLKVLV